MQEDNIGEYTLQNQVKRKSWAILIDYTGSVRCLLICKYINMIIIF